MRTATAQPKPWGRLPKPIPNPWPARMRTSLDPLRLSIFVLILMSIGRLHMHFPVLAAFRPALVATALILGYAILNPALLASGNLLRSWPAKVVLALFVMACFSVPFGLSMGHSGKYMLDVYWKTIVVAFLFIASIRNARDLYTLLWAFLISCAVLSYFALFVFPLTTYQGYARLDDFYSYDANDLGCVLTAGIGVALLLMRNARPFGRVVALITLVAMFATIAKTGSRGAFLGMLAAGIAFLVLVRGASYVWRVFAVVCAVAALTIWAPTGYWRQMKTILSLEEDYNYSAYDGRKQVAERGIDYMLKYPVFGLGIDNFAMAECTISERARNYVPGFPMRCTPPHNSYVQAGAELGVPGLLLWSSMMIGGLIGPLLLRRRLPKRWRRGDAEEKFLYETTVFLPVCFAGYAVSALFLTFAWLDISYFLAAMLAGLYYATAVKLRRNQVLPPPPRSSTKVPEWRTRARGQLQPVPTAGSLPSGAPG